MWSSPWFLARLCAQVVKAGAFLVLLRKVFSVSSGAETRNNQELFGIVAADRSSAGRFPGAGRWRGNTRQRHRWDPGLIFAMPNAEVMPS